MSECCKTCHYIHDGGFGTSGGKVYYCRRYPPEMSNNLPFLLFNLGSEGVEVGNL
jgi:hypothetical protein